MRPTITEQLRQAISVLGSNVLPEVEGRYAAEPLRSVISALEWIADRWETVVADLYAECDDWASLLGPAAAAGRFEDGLSLEIAELFAHNATDARPPVFPAAHELNLRWRELVERVIAALDAAEAADSADDVAREVRATLLRHATRW